MKRLFSVLLIICTLLSMLAGCSREDPDNYTPTGNAILLDGMDPEDLNLEPEEIVNLTLGYYPDRSMNPMIGNNITNRVLFSLMYQGLFAVDSRNVAYPILCDRYRVSSDNTIYTFYVSSKARFSDGSQVTSRDAFDSIMNAMERDYYRGRFTHVAEVKLRDDGGITFYLTTPYQNLQMLLDIPILKSTQLDAEHPLGTGPYEFIENGSNPFLSRVDSWWCDTEISTNADLITLVPCKSQAQVRDEFEFADLDLACSNPMFDSYAEYRCDYELWNVDNGVFLYLGVNVLYSKYFKDDNTVLRKALTYAIDRQTLNENNYRGLAQPTTLPTSPSSPYYNPGLASRFEYDPMKFLNSISGYTLPKDEKGQVIKMKLLVNSDDSARTRCAREIAATLTELGIPCGTLEYGSNDAGTKYEDGLPAGTYDLYLGQTKLPPNYDLSEFYRGYGNLRYGGLTDGTLLNMCKEALSNSGNYYNLNQMVAEDAKVIPVMFGQYCIYAERGQLLDLSPSRDNTFFYTIGLTMSDILEVSSS